MLVDSHCHLDFPELSGQLDDVLDRAATAGVAAMVTIGTRLSTFERTRAIAERFDHVYCTVGVHPHEAEQEGQDAPDRLIELARHPKVVGIGETGLDYFYDNSPRAQQAASFRAHIAAARATGLPLIVHSRDADDDMIAMLREGAGQGAEEGGANPLTGVLHCFSSGPGLAQAALDLGFYISLSGILTFKKADDLRAIAATVPHDRLLVETDAPYLAPVPHRGKTNEPAFVAHTAAALADVVGLSSADLAATTTANFYRLFTRARAPGTPAAVS